ncbi:MAG: zinc dependent phospholipase C family protein [Clostridia bacterium]|nr:zinc dependent phospholipase C family protein [Clostridia bacterium]
MPDYFSHIIIAEKILERLDGEYKKQITSNNLYLLGAQGGDVFFAYSFKFSKTNLGRALHLLSAEEVFSCLSHGNPSYAAGYATHYALDCTLHPAVYAYEAAHSSPFAHQKMESDLGLFISKFYGVRRRILPRESVLSCTSAVYDSIKLIEPAVTVTGVERCLKRHFNYTRYLFKTKKQAYKCNCDYSSLAGGIEDAIDLGVKAVQCVLDKNIDAAVFEKAFLQH